MHMTKETGKTNSKDGGAKGKMIAFPVQKVRAAVTPRYLSDPDEVIGAARTFIEGTGRKLTRPTTETMAEDLRGVLSLLLSVAPIVKNDCSTMAIAVRSLAMLALECDLANDQR